MISVSSVLHVFLCTEIWSMNFQIDIRKLHHNYEVLRKIRAWSSMWVKETQRNQIQVLSTLFKAFL